MSGQSNVLQEFVREFFGSQYDEEVWKHIQALIQIVKEENAPVFITKVMDPFLRCLGQYFQPQMLVSINRLARACQGKNAYGMLRWGLPLTLEAIQKTRNEVLTPDRIDQVCGRLCEGAEELGPREVDHFVFNEYFDAVLRYQRREKGPLSLDRVLEIFRDAIKPSDSLRETLEKAPPPKQILAL